jgi:glycosyltransferase involved in cell wall biosynthesis
VTIAWCTPFGVRSAIGQFSASVVKEMRLLGADVDICYPDRAGGRRYPDPGRRLPRGGGTDGGEVDLKDYEVVFYNIGNHYGYHGDLLRLAERYPGIVVLHDVSTIHLMTAYLLQMLPADSLRQLRRWYGDDAPGMLAGMKTIPDWPWRVENVHAFPLTEIALSNALSVVTHSHYAASMVRDQYVGEVWTLPLPALHVEHSDHGSVPIPMVDDRMVVLQAGVVNPNKRVPLVIEAFAASDLVDVAQLVVAGHVDRRVQADLKRQVNDLRLNGSVHLLGEVPDSVMYALRERAEVATVLRDPCTEAASASLLDAMASGSAVVAVDIGHYSETPDNAVSRVPPPPTVADVSAELRRLVRTPGLAADIGSRASRWVDEERMPRKYAAGILDVMDRVGVFDMRRRLARDLASNLRRTGAGPESRLTVAVADTAAELMGGEPRRAQELLIDRNLQGRV